MNSFGNTEFVYQACCCWVVVGVVDNDVAKFHKTLKRLQKRDETNKLGCLSLS